MLAPQPRISCWCPFLASGWLRTSQLRQNSAHNSAAYIHSFTTQTPKQMFAQNSGEYLFWRLDWRLKAPNCMDRWSPYGVHAVLATYTTASVAFASRKRLKCANSSLKNLLSIRLKSQMPLRGASMPQGPFSFQQPRSHSYVSVYKIDFAGRYGRRFAVCLRWR